MKVIHEIKEARSLLVNREAHYFASINYVEVLDLDDAELLCIQLNFHHSLHVALFHCTKNMVIVFDAPIHRSLHHGVLCSLLVKDLIGIFSDYGTKC